MYEHVGAAHLDEYMRQLHDLLRPWGLILNHRIVSLAPGLRRKDTFIWRSVFPTGSCTRSAASPTRWSERG